MSLDVLPDLALHRICLKLGAKDINSLLKTNKKLFNHIRANRVHYSKYEIREMRISLNKDGTRKVEVSRRYTRKVRKTITVKDVDEVIKSIGPQRLIIYDHDELVNMSPLWWRERAKVYLNNIIDYRRYLPYFDRCTTIKLSSDNPMNLSEILASKETKNLKRFSLSGDGKLECTNEDFRKIGRLSQKMMLLSLGNISESCKISSDAILDMIEIGSFGKYANIKLTRIPKNMLQCVRRRNWTVLRSSPRAIQIKTSNGLKLWIRKWERSFRDSDSSDDCRCCYRSRSYSYSSEDDSDN